jgi:hypothetical protein
MTMFAYGWANSPPSAQIQPPRPSPPARQS